MGARPLAALLATLLLACSTEQKVSGPLALTDEWTTVTPPEPLNVARYEQKACVRLDAVSDVDHGTVTFASGQRSRLEGEAIDNRGTAYALEAVGLSGDCVCLYRAGDYPRGPDFPAEIVSLRLRSSAPLEVREVTWHSYDPH